VKVLLDENIPHDLRPFLAHHETFTVAYMGWGGVKNGKLLDAAEADGFAVLITGDKTLEYEQDLSKRGIALVALSAVNCPLIEPNVAKIVESVDSSKPGTLTRVACGTFSRRRIKRNSS
jgi:predicted nuclease of predicted toxin-antitoxin system